MRSAMLLLAVLILVPTISGRAATDTGTVEAHFDAANKLYAQGKFSDAAAAYNQVLAQQSVSAPLYFNLGNACFKSGQIGRAIAAYRAAYQITPRDPDIQANLQFARNQVAGPRITASWWQRALGHLTRNEWILLSTITVWLAIGLFITRLLKPAWAMQLRTWAWVATIVMVFALGIAAFAQWQGRSSNIAIVVSADATIRNGPFDESPSTFTAHDGAELQVLDQKDNWLQVTDGGRNVGWIKREVVTF